MRIVYDEGEPTYLRLMRLNDPLPQHADARFGHPLNGAHVLHLRVGPYRDGLWYARHCRRWLATQAAGVVVTLRED